MFKHKKNLGQNFLINKDIIKKIADISNINKNTNIIEIGPGSGNLTDELLKEKNLKLVYLVLILITVRVAILEPKKRK